MSTFIRNLETRLPSPTNVWHLETDFSSFPTEGFLKALRQQGSTVFLSKVCLCLLVTPHPQLALGTPSLGKEVKWQGWYIPVL